MEEAVRQVRQRKGGGVMSTLVTCKCTLLFKTPEFVLPDLDFILEVGEVDEKNILLKREGVCLSGIGAVSYNVRGEDGVGTSLSLTNEWTFECPDVKTAERLVSSLADKNSPLESPLSFDFEYESDDGHTWVLQEGPETTCIIHP